MTFGPMGDGLGDMRGMYDTLREARARLQAGGSSARPSPTLDPDFLQREIEILTLVNRALIALLIEGGQITHVDLETRLHDLAHREWGGATNASPEALAADLKLKPEDDPKAVAERAEKEKLTQKRMRHFRRQD